MCMRKTKKKKRWKKRKIERPGWRSSWETEERYTREPPRDSIALREPTAPIAVSYLYYVNFLMPFRSTLRRLSADDTREFGTRGTIYRVDAARRGSEGNPGLRGRFMYHSCIDAGWLRFLLSTQDSPYVFHGKRNRVVGAPR